MRHGVVVLLAGLAASLSASAAVDGVAPPASEKATAIKWISLPDARLEMRGLPWLPGKGPGPLPGAEGAETKVPKAVWNRAVVPDGGRIRFSCNSTALGLRVQAIHEHQRRCFFDAFVN